MLKGSCRKCLHTHFFAPNINPDRVSTCIKMDCGCSEETFIPSDNIDYLEWKYKSKVNND